MTEAKTPDVEPPLLVWFDTEFTTLELEHARFMQVAARVTRFDLTPVSADDGGFVTPVRLPPDAAPSPWVLEHAGALVAAARAPDAPSPAEVETRLLALLDSAAASSGFATPEFVLAGNSIHTDWWLARRDLPRFIARLHYRQLDVTAYKLEWMSRGGEDSFDKTDPALVRQWFPAARAAETRGRHDAQYDIEASIAEMAFYRARLMRPAPSRYSISPPPDVQPR